MRMRIYTLTVLRVRILQMRHKHERSLLAICSLGASSRIVLEGRIAGSALPQTNHIPMLLASVIIEYYIPREAWPTNAHYWLDTRYAPRVLHFSAFHFSSSSSRYDDWMEKKVR